MIINKIIEDMKAAMKDKDSLRLNVLRMLKSAVKNKEIELIKTLDDKGVCDIIRSLVKQRQDSIVMFEKGGRQDLADNEKKEIEVLSSYLPKSLTKDEIDTLVKQVIADLGVDSIKGMGAVMKEASLRAEGRIDGKSLSEAVKGLLAA